MNQTEGKPQSDHTESPQEETFDSKWVAWNDSHPNLWKIQLPRDADEGTGLEDYHLTARVRNSSLNVKQLSLLLEVLEYQILHFGCNFAMYLGMVHLYQRCLGQKYEADDINDSKIRKTLLVAEIIIREIGNFEFSLDSREVILFSGKIAELLKENVMDKRTYGSRFVTWRPERFIVIRAVPVNVVFDRSPSDCSQRYSGYTKGYGESHPSAHKIRTKPSFELDGDSDPTNNDQRNLFHRMFDAGHQMANMLWIKYRNLKVD